MNRVTNLGGQRKGRRRNGFARGMGCRVVSAVGLPERVNCHKPPILSTRVSAIAFAPNSGMTAKSKEVTRDSSGIQLTIRQTETESRLNVATQPLQNLPQVGFRRLEIGITLGGFLSRRSRKIDHPAVGDMEGAVTEKLLRVGFSSRIGLRSREQPGIPPKQAGWRDRKA